MRVLVTGGAGYIGSHTCLELLEAGYEVFTLDNLDNGHIAAIERVQHITGCELGFAQLDIRDEKKLKKVFADFKPEAVMHFAGLKSVSQSVAEPLLYYDVNVGSTISLLKAMSYAECNNIVFSSSATVYGLPKYLPYDESHPTCPVNPYGRTKLFAEEIINDWVIAQNPRIGTVLRYFNPVGAHFSGQIGEEPCGIPNNLMPFIAQVAVGRQDYLKIFGNNFDTLDGTGSRDYIHVVDLAKAHIKALESQFRLKPFQILNIGRGKGITVMELIEAFEKASGVSIKYKFVNSREGDLPAFWANTSLAEKELNWSPRFDINQMCKDTWYWQSNNINGY